MAATPWNNSILLRGHLTILEGAGYLDLNKQEIRNALFQGLGSEPAEALAGQFIFNTSRGNAAKSGRFGYKTGGTTPVWIYPDMSKNDYDTNDDGVVNSADNADKLDSQGGSYYLSRANHTGTQLASTISDFAEAAQDAIGAALADTNSIQKTYDDTNNQIKHDLKLNGSDLRIQAAGVDLNPTGISQGAYTKVTVDTKGRVTAGATLGAGDLPLHSHNHSQISDFDTGVRHNSLDQMTAPAANVDFNNKKIINLADPVNDQDACNKRYTDALFTVGKWKDSVKAIARGNVALSGLQIVDTYQTQDGDRILVSNNDLAAENGIYNVHSGAWARSTDADTWAKIVSACVFVEKGSEDYKDTSWNCTSDPGGTLGTTAVTWTQFNGAASIIWGAALGNDGNEAFWKYDDESLTVVDDTATVKLATLSALSKSGGMAVVPDGVTLEINEDDQLAIKGSFKVQKITSLIEGDGSTTDFQVATTAIGAKSVISKLADAATGETVYAGETSDTAKVIFSFEIAPIVGENYDVTILG